MNAQVNHRVDIDKLERMYPNAYFDTAPGCAEPGYDTLPVILADWNHVPDKVYAGLERLGYACEWSDEWTSCSNCGRVFRTSPDSYQWQMAGIIWEGEALCLDCLNAADYMESMENNPRMALTWPVLERYDPEDYGYKLVEKGFENGWYEGQNADPRLILKAALERDPAGRYLFAMTSQGQFDLEFSLYRRLDTEDEDV